MNETTNVVWESLWEGLSPHATEAQIAEAESRTGLSFPASFRTLLAEHQGQMPTPSAGHYTGPDGEATWVDIGAIYHVDPDAEDGNYLVNEWQALQAYFEGEADQFPPGFPEKLLPFTDDPGGSPVCLDFRAGGEPAVVRVQYHDRFWAGTITPLAPSLEAFLAGLSEIDASEYARAPEVLPGVPVGVTWPPDFFPMDGFPGVANPITQSSIVVHALPAPFDELSAGINRENLLKQGVRLDAEESLTLDGQRARLLRCGQSAGEVEVDKWLLLLEGEGKTALLTATFPVSESYVMAQPLREALLTAHWVETEPEGPVFQLGETPALSYATTWSGMDVYTPDGRFVPGEPGDAVFFAGYGYADIEGEEAQRRFCTDRIGGLDNDLMGVTITTMRDITVSGVSGFEGQAVGTSRKSGQRNAVYQVVLFEEGRYVILVGTATEATAPQYVPAFQALVAGFRAAEDLEE